MKFFIQSRRMPVVKSCPRQLRPRQLLRLRCEEAEGNNEGSAGGRAEVGGRCLSGEQDEPPWTYIQSHPRASFDANAS